MLVFLGWNPGTPKELFSMEELSNIFSLEREGKSGTNLILTKQDGLIKQYLRQNQKKIYKDLQKIFKTKWGRR